MDEIRPERRIVILIQWKHSKLREVHVQMNDDSYPTISHIDIIALDDQVEVKEVRYTYHDGVIIVL